MLLVSNYGLQWKFVITAKATCLILGTSLVYRHETQEYRSMLMLEMKAEQIYLENCF